MINTLFIKKLAIAAAVAFVGAFVPLLGGIGQAPNYTFEKSAWVAALFAGIGAVARALLAFGPWPVVPSDAQHSLFPGVRAKSVDAPAPEPVVETPAKPAAKRKPAAK